MTITRTRFILLIAVTALLLSIPAIVSAQSARPSKYGGNAFIDGEKAPEGTLVEALSGETVVGSTKVKEASDQTNYILIVEKPSGPLELTFKVDGKVAEETPTSIDGEETSTWMDGKIRSGVDLHANSVVATPTPPATPTPQSTTAPVRGPVGPAGPAGEMGAAGPQGPQGIRGAEGAQGPTGERGADGRTGPQGETGVQGIQGPQGVAGPSGPSGPAGSQGVAGPAGSSGSFLIAIIALVVAFLALLIAVGFWIWGLQSS